MRVENWRTELTAHIHAHMTREFEWGQHDCVLWAASCIEKITGINHASDVAGTYSTPEGGYKAIVKAFDCHQITELCAKLLGPAIHVASAIPGDIVYKKSNVNGFDAVLGICNGRFSIFVNDTGGLVNIETIELDGAYRVK